MRFRLGFVSGFAAGYYLGAKAGRQRYEEIQRTLDKVRSTDAYETAATKVKSVVDEGVEKAKTVSDEVVEKAKTVSDEVVDKAKTLVDEGKEKAKSIADRRGGSEADTSPGNGTGVVATVGTDPSAAPDGAGSTTSAQPAEKPGPAASGP